MLSIYRVFRVYRAIDVFSSAHPSSVGICRCVANKHQVIYWQLVNGNTSMICWRGIRSNSWHCTQGKRIIKSISNEILLISQLMSRYVTQITQNLAEGASLRPRLSAFRRRREMSVGCDDCRFIGTKECASAPLASVSPRSAACCLWQPDGTYDR